VPFEDGRAVTHPRLIGHEFEQLGAQAHYRGH